MQVDSIENCRKLRNEIANFMMTHSDMMNTPEMGSLSCLDITSIDRNSWKISLNQYCENYAIQLQTNVNGEQLWRLLYFPSLRTPMLLFTN